MQTTGAADLIKFPPQLGHTVANHSPVRFNLGFARSTKKAETAALSLQVSPTPHQPTCLIVEMRQFNLQPAFSGRGALTENFQDQEIGRASCRGRVCVRVALGSRRIIKKRNNQMYNKLAGQK